MKLMSLINWLKQPVRFTVKMSGKLSILFAFFYLYSIGIVKTGNTKVPSTATENDNTCAPPDQYTSIVQSLLECANALKHCHKSQCIQPCPLPSSCKEIKETVPIVLLVTIILVVRSHHISIVTWRSCVDLMKVGQE